MTAFLILEVTDIYIMVRIVVRMASHCACSKAVLSLCTWGEANIVFILNAHGKQRMTPKAKNAATRRRFDLYEATYVEAERKKAAHKIAVKRQKPQQPRNSL